MATVQNIETKVERKTGFLAKFSLYLISTLLIFMVFLNWLTIEEIQRLEVMVEEANRLNLMCN